MRLRVFHLAAVVSLLAFIPGEPVRAAAQGEQVFAQGIRAFRAGDYPAALQSFLEARRAGLDTPGLRYNLGVTYYRLGRYPEAEREFQALARDPEWSALAHYNLGLVAQRMGREQLAIEYFDRAHGTSADLNLRTLAATALERLGRAPLPLRTAALVSLAGGYDSNATFAPDAAAGAASRQSDFFAEALAAASHRLAGNAASGWYAHGGLILRKYGDLSQFDLTGLRAGLSHETDSGRSLWSVGGHIDAVYVDGKRVEQAAVVDLQARSRLDAGGDLRWRYQLGRVEGGAGFEYLDGWQQRLSVDAGLEPAPALVRLGYQLELNHRRDLQQGGEFTSYSPTRHSLFATYTVPDARGWRTEVRGEYRLSRYDDPYRLNGGALEVVREDDRYGFALRGNRRSSAPWSVFVEYSYYRNRSTLDTYGYDRHQLMAGMEATLEK